MTDSALQYIDYAVHERLMDVTASRQFWRSELEGYNLQHPLPLPMDRHRASTDQRSGLASVAEIVFDKDVSTGISQLCINTSRHSFSTWIGCFLCIFIQVNSWSQGLMYCFYQCQPISTGVTESDWNVCCNITTPSST